MARPVIGDPLLKPQVVADALGVEVRWLDDAPMEWEDLRKPGARRPVRRWRRSVVEAFLEARRVKPGHRSPVA